MFLYRCKFIFYTELYVPLWENYGIHFIIRPWNIISNPPPSTPNWQCAGGTVAAVLAVLRIPSLRYRNEHVQSVEVNPPYGQAQDSGESLDDASTTLQVTSVTCCNVKLKAADRMSFPATRTINFRFSNHPFYSGRSAVIASVLASLQYRRNGEYFRHDTNKQYSYFKYDSVNCNRRGSIKEINKGDWRSVKD